MSRTKAGCIAEYDNGAAVTSPSRESIYSTGIPGTGLLASISAGAITYFHSDHLSWRVSTDVNGNPNGAQGHYPFGESWYSSNGNEFVFTSYQRDSESGLDYAMARYYDSTAGRFCSVDPVGGDAGDPQTWNRYAYVRNDPIDKTDPSGKSWWEALGAAFLYALAPMTGGATLPGAQLLATDNMLRETGKAFANGQMPPLFGGFGGGMVIGSSWDGSTNIYDRGLTNGIQSALGLPTMADAMNPAMDATLGIRASGQTWKNCMSANANTYSIGGSVQLAANVAFKKNASISSNTLVSAVTGNSINTFFFGSSADAGAGMAVNSPGLVSTAMGSSITYGRNSTQIMALNIARAGGAPQALSQASSGVKALLGKAGNVLSLGMSFATRTAVDIGFTGAEAINRAMQQ